MLLDFNRAFPAASDGSQSPLPKQKLFLDLALKSGTPKYIRYVGGIGSGKTLIGCIVMLALAVMYPGDYLIARQFMPELRDTTLKTFLEVLEAVGKELMIEYRVADAVIRVRSRGGSSNILFRGLEEPDKLRSLNLNAFHIDEAAQVSEAAFLLLQGRLRGKHVRKGFLTQNSGGHDWTYRYFVKQDMFKNEDVKKEFFNIRAPSTENIHLPEGYVETILQSWSEDRIRREIYADEDSFAGQVYNEFRSDIHVVPPFAIPKEWTKIAGVDHGYRNPAAWIWGAVDYDGNIYIYREFYQKEWVIEEIVKGKGSEAGVLELMRDSGSKKLENVQAAYIDPSTRASRGVRKNGRVYTDYDEYVEHLPQDFPLVLANNEKTAGIDRVKGYLKVNPRTGRPRLFVFNTCKNLVDEIAKYRYEELPTGQIGKKNEKEEPRKVDDHACFVAGTPVRTIKGLRPIETICPGDLVLTRYGFQPVLASACLGPKPVVKAAFSNGQEVIATPDHPFFTQSGDKKALGLLTPCDTVSNISVWQRLFLTESYLGKLGLTTAQTVRTVNAAWSRYTEKFGNFITGLSPRVGISTTRMAIPTTTRSQTWSALVPNSIMRSTGRHTQYNRALLEALRISPELGPKPPSGIDPKRVGLGTGNMADKSLQRSGPREVLKRCVRSVIGTLWLIASRPTGANSAIRIVSKQPYGVADVYNLSVANYSEYYVGDLLVSNCDALRYLVMAMPEAPKEAEEIWQKIKYNSIEGNLYRELQGYKKPPQKDPFHNT